MRRLLLGAVIAVSLGLFVVFLVREVPKSLDGTALPDFPNYYFGGERLFDGRPIYGSLEAEVEERFGVAGYDAYPADPPPTVVLLAPLSLLPYEPAWMLLAGISILIVVGVLYVTAREVGYPRDLSTAVAYVALLSTSVRFLVARNHVESLVLLAGFLGWRALRRERSAATGVWWGLATSLKLFPGMWLVGMVRRRIRGLIVGAVTVVAAGIVSLLVVGGDNFVDFASEVVGASRRWYGTLGNYSLLSFGTALAGAWLGWALLGVGAAVLVPLFLRKEMSADQLWVAGTAVALLLSPLSWLNYLVLALPALVIVGGRLDIRAPRDRWLLLGLVASLGFWGPVVFSAEVPSVLVSFVPTYGLIALFGVAMTRLGAATETPNAR